MQYSKLAKTYTELENTTKRLQKTHLLSEFLKTVSDDDLEHVMLLLEGRVFPAWDSREIGVAARTILKAISVATGKEAEKIEELWKKIGDLGKVAEQLMTKKTQSTLFSKTLSSIKVFDNLQKIATMEGEGTVDRKVKLIAELLTSSTPEEAKYLVRTIIGELRAGLGEGTIRDAILWENFGKEIGIKYDEKEKKLDMDDKIREKYNSYSTAVQEAYDVVNDFAKVAKLARKGLKVLGEVSLEPGKPMKVMLYQKAKDMNEAFETVGTPAIIEFKYDGFRLVISKKKNKIMLFTRRLENVTEQFPDVVEAVEKYVEGDEFILDSETVGFDVKTKKYLPFQSISQRIRRKYDIKEISEKFPVEINVFDMAFFEGKSLLKTPFEERRKIIEKI
ncbi:MAG: ATP-dependent DNA ligase, partial [Nanoarchaeota archaeon]